MKLAVLSDVHGNLAALEAVAADIDAWQPDAVAMAGDVVNRGPQPVECFDFVQQRVQTHAWRVIRGNHEGYVLSLTHPPSHPVVGLEGEIRENVAWTYRRFVGRLHELAELPTQISLVAPDGGEIRVVHGSMRSDRDNILVTTSDAVLREQIHPAPAVFCCGHTHRALVRRIDTTLVVNAGAVGMPFDGDLRAAYARLEWQAGRWHAQIVRVPYDRERTQQAFTESGYMAQAGIVARIVFDEFRTAYPRLLRWNEWYNPRVLAGELTPAETVDLFLEQAGDGQI